MSCEAFPLEFSGCALELFIAGAETRLWPFLCLLGLLQVRTIAPFPHSKLKTPHSICCPLFDEGPVTQLKWMDFGSQPHTEQHRWCSFILKMDHFPKADF